MDSDGTFDGSKGIYGFGLEIGLHDIGYSKTIRTKHPAYTDQIYSLKQKILQLKKELKKFNENVDDSIVDKKRICGIINQDISSAYAHIISLIEDSY